MYSVRLSHEAERFYAKAALPLAKKIARCFEQLEAEPRHHPNIAVLKGKLKGCYRYRMGDHRVVYAINEESQVVDIVTIGPRQDVYD